MADITTLNQISQAGLSLTYTACSEEGDKFEGTGKNKFVVIKNTSEGEITVTIVAQTTSFDSPVYGTSSVANATIAVAPNATGCIGPFPSMAFNDSDGYVNMTYSSHTNLSVAICSL
jgi:hypothetical protein